MIGIRGRDLDYFILGWINKCAYVYNIIIAIKVRKFIDNFKVKKELK